MFNAEEVSYLVGLIAAKSTETCKVGFIVGTKSPIIESFEYWFLSGVESVGKNVKTLRQYADTYTDAAKGKAIAKQMHNKDVDVIFIAAGSTGSGAIEAARENKKMAIGVDNVVYNNVKSLKEGNFKGGEVSVYGLKEDGVGIAPTTKNFVSEEILTFVEEKAEKIKSGDIIVPANKEEYNKLK